MKNIYEKPELRYCILDNEGAFMTLSGLQVQVDEFSSNGYDAGTSSGSEYMIDFDD